MSTPARRRRGSGRGGERRPGDLWHPVPAPPDAEPIVPATEPTALLRSLGDPPLPASSVAANHYVATVIERAAALASALAASADLLAEPDDRSDDG